MSLKGSQQRPLIFEIEDLHWIDKTSEEYLASLVESLPGAAILLLTTYRPGYRPPWIEKSYATQLSLHNLAPQDALTVVHSTSHQHALPAASGTDDHRQSARESVFSGGINPGGHRAGGPQAGTQCRTPFRAS